MGNRDHTVTVRTTDGKSRPVKMTKDEARRAEDLPFTATDVQSVTVVAPR
jgi:hypothetical protein